MVKSISLPAINSPFRPGKTKGPTHIRGIPIDEAGDAPPPVLTGSREASPVPPSIYYLD